MATRCLISVSTRKKKKKKNVPTLYKENYKLYILQKKIAFINEETWSALDNYYDFD